MSSSEPTPSPVPELEELVLQHPPLPHISEHTGGLPAMDMRTMSGVDEERKGVCGKCEKCLACTRRTEGGE